MELEDEKGGINGMAQSGARAVSYGDASAGAEYVLDGGREEKRRTNKGISYGGREEECEKKRETAKGSDKLTALLKKGQNIGQLSSAQHREQTGGLMTVHINDIDNGPPMGQAS
jgi:hypothetical protein